MSKPRTTPAWEGSDRAARLPRDWRERRAKVLERDGHRCTVLMRNGSRCRDRATEVDHIVPGDDHRLDNLRAICAWHHARKSSAEGNAARTRLSSYREPERHPGLA